MYRIMVVEDDAAIAGVMRETLEKWGYGVHCAVDFRDVMAEFAAWDPQLVLLDISLPFYGGFHWCTEIRKRSKIPVVFVSSASDNMNLIMAMNLGADDFIAKPFDLPVFVAKIQAILRRAYAFGGQTNILAYGRVLLNLADATLTHGEACLDLTRSDFRVMQLLMENPGEIVSRSAIMDRLWESDSFIDDNTLTVTMTRLRKKLVDIGLDDFILTKKGIGYGIRTEGTRP